MKATFNTGKNVKPLIPLMLALGGLFAPFAISSHAADRVPDLIPVSVRADGDTKPENTRGFATELATYLACTLIEGGITDVLTDINQADGNDPVTGFLIQLLAGPPSPDATALTNIQDSIKAVQDQLTQLQANFSAFEAKVNTEFMVIEQEVTASIYDDVVKPLNNYNATLNDLSSKYNAIRTTYYTAGVPATHDPIDPVEQIQIY